ncbi:MAG: hypothetical protein GYB64_04920 [Chloroflexi bacterium]|nr:hypothetical protein [Chloroflexota bacterium]
MAILVLNGVLVPTSILGMGLGATALIRNPETNRLAVAGVLGNGCYLFLGSMLLLFSL